MNGIRTKPSQPITTALKADRFGASATDRMVQIVTLVVTSKKL
jgi:hypothetical protein